MNKDKLTKVLTYWVGITSVIGIGTIVNWLMKLIFWLSTGMKL